MPLAVIWKAPFDQCKKLQLLPGTTNSFVWDCSRDGQTLIGYCVPDPGYEANTRRPCKWDKTTLAVTELTAVAGVTPGAEALCISPDGSIIITRNTSSDGSVNLPYCRFTDGGAAGAFLQPAAGFISPSIGPSLPMTYYGTGVQRLLGVISDDNSTIIGESERADDNVPTTPFEVATRWLGTSPATLPLGPGTFFPGSQASCVTADGHMTVGHYNAQIPDMAAAVFWQGSTGPFILLPPHGVPWAQGYASVVNASGSVIWGITHIANPEGTGAEFCYWDNLTAVAHVGGIDYYGVPHIIVGRQPYTGGTIDTVISSIAVDGTTPIFCGGDSYSPGRGLKWINSTTPTVLDVLPGSIPSYDWSVAYSMSGDGSIVVGSGSGGPDAPYYEWGIWWDASLVPHMLPTLSHVDFNNSGVFGRATGISRDGSTIFGIADVSFTLQWTIRSNVPSSDAGIGDLWIDPSYVDFSDPTIRRKFINADKSWVYLGDNGDLPTGDSPMVFNTVHDDTSTIPPATPDPSDPLDWFYGYGQWGSASGWNLFPDTDEPAFDVCVPSGPAARLTMDNLLVEDNLNIDDVFSIIYRWRSREFYQMAPISLGACQISLDPEVTLPAPATSPLLNSADPLTMLPPGVNAIFRLYVGPESKTLYFTKVLDQPRMIFRLPSGLKAFNWQFEIVARVPIHSVELASTMRELQQV